MEKKLKPGKIKVILIGIVLLVIIAAYQLIPFVYLGFVAKIDIKELALKYLEILIVIIASVSVIIWIFIYLVQNFYKENIRHLEITNSQLNNEIKERQKLQSELLESRTQLELALEGGQANSWDMNLVTRTLTHTDTWAKNLGYQTGEINQTIEVFNGMVHPNDLPKNNSSLETFIRGDVPIFETEYRLRTKAGNWIWVVSRGKAVEWDAIGKPTRLMGTNFDITERKLAEEKIIESEQRFRRTFDQSPIGAAIVSLDLYFLRANEALCKIIDYSEDELTKLKFSDITYSEDLAYDMKQVQKLKSGEIEQFNTVKRYIRKNGSLVWAEVTVRVLKDIADKPICYLPMIQDLSDRKKMEEALQEERNLLRTIVDNLPIALYLKDDKARKVLSNPMDLRYIGKTESEVLGKTDNDFYTKEIADNTIADDMAVINSGEPIFNREEHIVNALGESIWLLTSKIPQKNKSGKTIGIIGMGLEITKRKLAEEELINAKERAEESDKLKSAFLANMSHEIRTPMNAILGFSELLTRPGLTEEKKVKFTRLINNRAFDLLQIIEDILDISKIEIGQMKLIKSQINIYNLLKDLYEYYLLRKDNLKPNSQIKFNFTPDEIIKNYTIYIDDQRIKQILTNFLDNSFKFTFEGTIDLGCKITESNELLFYVSDTGIGIPLNKQQIIFDRFRQAEDIHTAQHYGGTGLGLSIAKGLSDLMGGKIWVESEVGKGTCFYFSIPSIKSSMIESHPIEKEKPKDFIWDNFTFLIVEDNLVNAVLLGEILIDTHASLLNAYTGKEAMDIFRENSKVDLVLLDIRLPDANGLEIAKEMRQLRPEVIIIAQTAYASHSELVECLVAGCNNTISKPIQSDKLMKLIGQYITKP